MFDILHTFLVFLFPFCLAFPNVGFGKFSTLTYEQLRETQPSYANWVLRTRFKEGSRGAALKDWLRTGREQRKQAAMPKAPLIANVVGSSSDKPYKFGYSSWKDVWLASTGRSWPRLCAYFDCKNHPTLGGHVYMKGSRQEPFIVPICKSCNSSPSRDYYKGYSAPTRHVAVALPALTGDMVDGKGFFAKRKTRGAKATMKTTRTKKGNKIVTKKFGRLASVAALAVSIAAASAATLSAALAASAAAMYLLSSEL
ncbi:hypothetical protein ScalyP_jg9285 [Parmales sp. scaly parma]|nr:hypothetical protein ScalyP_jg9285 [Parmales sp. scaly parma]